METDKTTQRVPIRELVKYYLRLGLLGFGGPVALVGQMEREMVGERKWLTKEEMREGIAVCQSLPGPLAIQVGIWISYIRGGFWGAWAGGWAFILPNFIIVAARGCGGVGGVAAGALASPHRLVGVRRARWASSASIGGMAAWLDEGVWDRVRAVVGVRGGAGVVAAAGQAAVAGAVANGAGRA